MGRRPRRRRRAFGLLFDRHGRAVYNHCFRLVGSWGAAEDLTQTVFLMAWRTRARVRMTTDSALPWLLGVATNVVRTHHRSTTRRLRIARRLPGEDVPELVHGCVDSAGVGGTFELKLAFADAAGEDRPTVTFLGGFQQPISVDLDQVSTVEGSPEHAGYQVVIGRVDPATTARVTLTEKDVTMDAVLVGGVYAARVVRPADWWLTGDRPPPVVDAYNAEGDLVGSASPHHR